MARNRLPPRQAALVRLRRPPATGCKGWRLQAEVLVLGSRSGGYAAAFRAADLDAKVGAGRAVSNPGWCVPPNVGCIPSKALLHAAKVIAETKEMAENGISFGPPSIEVDKLRGWKDSVVTRLTSGVLGLGETARNVEGYYRRRPVLLTEHSRCRNR